METVVTEVHVHSYIRVPKIKGGNRPEVFKCNDPHCQHTQRRLLLNGKASLCPACGREFILDWTKLQRAVPKCDDCSNTKSAKQKRAAKALIEKLSELTPKELKDGEFILD